MRHLLRFGLLLCILVPSMGAFAGGSLPGGLPSIPSSNYPYFQTLKSYSFDSNGSPDPQGWTTHDLTEQYGVFWHVDNFAGVGPGYAPLAGAKSLWCGVRAGVVTDPPIPNAPGYGDRWMQVLQLGPFTSPDGPFASMRLMGRLSCELMGNDRLDVEYRSTVGSGPWTNIVSYTGSNFPFDRTWGPVLVGDDARVEFRFVMSSDHFDSDESNLNTFGAVFLDNFTLKDDATATIVWSENFESSPVGSTSGSNWQGVAPAGFGNYAGLVNGSNIPYLSDPNLTHVWSFFNGSTDTQAICGGSSSQPVVPYTRTPGSKRLCDFIYNEVRSPWIDLTIDENNQPVDPSMTTLAADFDLYAEFPNGGNNIYYGYRWRFIVNGVLQPWAVPFLFNTSAPFWSRQTTLKSGGIAIPPGATQVQFCLVVLDGGFSALVTPTCHTVSPLFDNVSIVRMYNPVRVFNANDSGDGSMRQAIIDANASADFNSMVFLIPGSDAHTINLNSPLPAVTQPLWIDGFSQLGALANTSQGANTNATLRVMLNGASAGGGANGLYYWPGSYGVVRGLAIGGFSAAGIRSQSTSLIVTGCYIGTDITGTTPAPNATGVLAVTDGMNIGGSPPSERMLISNSAGDGIDIMAGSGPILNCRVGYDALGFEMANGDGIHVFGGSHCQIGEPAYGPCVPEYNDRVWIEAGNIVVDPAASGVSIWQIRLDGGYIDLGSDGPGNANDAGDVDTGANGMQNYPVLTGAGATTVAGDMDGAPNTVHHVEFYSGDGFSGVYNYLGYEDVTTNGAGHASISFSCAPTVPGSHITAIATANFNTSEFGPWITYNNTNPGLSGIPINLYDAQQLLRASVQYSSVLSTGNTFLNEVTPSSTPIPSLWNVGGTPHYWDITNNVGYGGSVQVCVYYDPAQVPGPEGVLRLLHYQNGGWADVTTAVDPVNNVICGVVSSLSPFVIAKRTNATAVGELPDVSALHANIPNPFNPATTINYDVRRGGADVNIAIYDVSGRLVRTLVREHRAAGHYGTQWNGVDDAGRAVASGVYFYRMQAGTFNQTRKMVLLK